LIHYHRDFIGRNGVRVMEITLEKASESDAQSIFDIQVNAFSPLLEVYKDYNTNPANETIERLITRINNPSGGVYKIKSDTILVGAISILWKEETQFWISPMFILPKYQGQGIAQKAITQIEKIFPQAVSWELATIAEEKRNCYLYEKMGFTKTGEIKEINDRMTLIFFKKSL
jgi:RimJ/RimL family protein N-acetyltransferase